jgi:hypothetical protein
MKKLLHPKYLPIFVSFAAVLGFVLRLFALAGGTDAEGLYALSPVIWVLLWIITAAVPVMIILMTRSLTEPVKYNKNFPASLVSAIGSLLAGVGFALAGLESLLHSADTFTFLSGILGLASAVFMALVAYARLKGNKPFPFCHLCVCLFFALRTFSQSRMWGNEPQIGLFIFAFLAQICAMLAAYQLSAFDLELGNRRSSLFWSLSATYLSLVALPSSDDLLFFGCIAVWLLTNLCSLRPVKKRKAVPQEPANPVQAQISGSDVSIDEIKTWLEEE